MTPSALRLAYLVPEALMPMSGVGQKVVDQATTWASLGVDVGVFLLSTVPDIDAPWPKVTFSLQTENWEHMNSLVGNEMRRQRALGRLTARLLEWRPDATYLRFAPYFLSVERVLARGTAVLEINSDDLAEYRLRRAPLSAYNRLTRRRILTGASGTVYPTQELLRRNARRRQHPSIVIGNGIDLSLVEPIPAPRNERAVLVMTASSAAPWQGIDKVRRLARRLPQFDFHIAGVDQTTTERNLHFHGFLTGGDYEALLANADVALGSLALHRAGLSEATPLKVRRYMASGIPTVIAYVDPDLDETVPLLLRIPNNEANVETHAAAVADFVGRAKGERVPRASLSAIDQTHKESRRIDFIRDLVSNA